MGWLDDAFKAVTNVITAPVKAIVEGVQHIGKEVEKGVHQVGHAIEGGVQHIGKEIEKETHKLGNAIEDGAQHLGKEIEKEAHKVGEFVEDHKGELLTAAQIIGNVVLAPTGIGAVAWNGIMSGIRAEATGGEFGDGLLQGGITGAIPIIGDKLGNAIDLSSEAVQGGLSAVHAASQNNAGGVVGAVLGMAGADQEIAKSVGGIVSGVQHGDIGTAANGIMQLSGVEGDIASGVGGFVTGVQQGNLGSALNGFMQATGVDSDVATGIGGIVGGVQSGDLSAVFGGAIGIAGIEDGQVDGMLGDLLGQVGVDRAALDNMTGMIDQIQRGSSIEALGGAFGIDGETGRLAGDIFSTMQHGDVSQAMGGILEAFGANGGYMGEANDTGAAIGELFG